MIKEINKDYNVEITSVDAHLAIRDYLCDMLMDYIEDSGICNIETIFNEVQEVRPFVNRSDSEYITNRLNQAVKTNVERFADAISKAIIL